MSSDDSLSLVKFCTLNFFATLLSSRPMQPISTLLIKLVDSLIASETEPDPKMAKRLKWIYENTHERVNAHLSVIELVVFRNLDKGVNKEIDIGTKTFTLAELYYILDDISRELSQMVIIIAKKYSMDMPLLQFTKSTVQKMNLEND